MGRRYVISGENRLRIFETGATQEIRSAYIGGAGALCAGNGRIFCADEYENVIWSLDADMLIPRAVFASGPQVCDLHLSPDGQRLYVLCGGADSVLMLDAGNGAPQLLARAGVNPQRMALSSGGDVLAIAGGVSERVILLDALSLVHIRDIPMPGPVQDVVAGKLLHALCYGEETGSLLVSADGSGKRTTRALCGLPGALLLGKGAAFAATHGWIDRFDPDAPHCCGRMLHAPGRAGRMILLDDRLIYTDMYAHAAFSLNLKSSMSEKICSGALEAAAL